MGWVLVGMGVVAAVLGIEDSGSYAKGNPDLNNAKGLLIFLPRPIIKGRGDRPVAPTVIVF